MASIPLSCQAALGLVLAALSCSAAAPRVEQPLVADVRAAFAHLGEVGHRLGAWGGDQLPYPFYSLNRDHDVGDNHFQGVQRLRAGAYLVLSGSNISREGDSTRYGVPKSAHWDELPLPHGDLIIVRLGARPTSGPLGPNIDSADRPDAAARVVATVPIRIPLASGTTLWHPGGLGACGDILVVPVENYSAKHGEVCSQILFFDMSDPERPRRLRTIIDRSVAPVKDKAGAATMIRLADGRFMVASRTTTEVSFYLSRSTELEDGFEADPASVVEEKSADNVHAAAGLPFRRFGGSSFQFIRQKDGQLFLANFAHTKPADEKNEEDRQVISLWQVDFPRGDYRSRPNLTRVADREYAGELFGENRWALFPAAAGIFVTDDGALAIYSTPRWMVRRVGEFTLDDLRAGRGLSSSDQLFIPAIELWPAR